MKTENHQQAAEEEEHLADNWALKLTSDVMLLQGA